MNIALGWINLADRERHTTLCPRQHVGVAFDARHDHQAAFFLSMALAAAERPSWTGPQRARLDAEARCGPDFTDADCISWIYLPAMSIASAASGRNDQNN